MKKILLSLGLLAAVLAGCGDDDGAEVRDIGGEGSEPGSASGSGSGSASEPGSGSASGTQEEAECVPVGDPATATVSLDVVLDDFTITTSTDEIAAGAVELDIVNEGEHAHEVVVVRADAVADLPLVEGQIDEDALPEGSFIGEVEAFPAGESCAGVFDLEPGSYVLFCNILEEEDGEEVSHFVEGMSTVLDVT